MPTRLQNGEGSMDGEAIARRKQVENPSSPIAEANDEVTRLAEHSDHDAASGLTISAHVQEPERPPPQNGATSKGKPEHLRETIGVMRSSYGSSYRKPMVGRGGTVSQFYSGIGRCIRGNPTEYGSSWNNFWRVSRKTSERKGGRPKSEDAQAAREPLVIEHAPIAGEPQVP
jgi:hypothetical protein